MSYKEKIAELIEAAKEVYEEDAYAAQSSRKLNAACGAGAAYDCRRRFERLREAIDVALATKERKDG